MLRTLHSKLLFFLLLITSIPMLAMGYISYHSQREALTVQLEQTLNMTAGNTAIAIQELVNESINDISYLAQNPVIRNSDATIEDIKVEFEAFLEHHDLYKDIIFVNTEGLVKLDMIGNVVTGNDLSDRSWFAPALEGEVYFSDVYYSPVVKRPILPVAAPVRDENNNIIGVLSTTFDLNHLWLKIKNVTIERKSAGLSSYAFLLNDEGEIITHPDQTRILSENFFEANHLDFDKVKNFSQNEEIFFNDNDGTLNSFACIEPVDGFDNYWHIVVAVPKEELYASLSDLLVKYIIFIVLLLAVTTIVAINLAKFIVKPINELVKANQDFAAGKKMLPLQTDTYEEINTLKNTFNMMVEKLEERERELIWSEKLKTVGQLSAGLAHEIRNPLTTIKGFVQLFDRRSDDNNQDKLFYQQIIKEIDRVDSLITDLLNLAKPGSPDDIIITSINEVIEEIVIFYLPQLEEKNIKISANYGKLPSTCINVKQLKQVAINLIKNAYEALSDGGELTITTNYLEEENTVAVVIADNGCGMDQQTIDKLGTPFYTTKETGTGLGLLTTFRIIEEMKGFMEIKSEPGVGSRFIVNLPVISNQVKNAERYA